jgi:hypothetical protein
MSLRGRKLRLSGSATPSVNYALNHDKSGASSRIEGPVFLSIRSRKAFCSDNGGEDDAKFESAGSAIVSGYEDNNMRRILELRAPSRTTTKWRGPQSQCILDILQQGNKECSKALHNGGRHVAMRTHSDIADCVRKLNDGMLRGDLKEILRSKLTAFHANEDEMLENSINLAASLVLMMSFCGYSYGFSGRSQLRWDQDSLRSFVLSYFEPGSDLTKQNVKLDKIFIARNLSRIVGLEIIWTDNLVDHLRMTDDDRRVHIFHHASFLEVQRRRWIHSTAQAKSS